MFELRGKKQKKTLTFLALDYSIMVAGVPWGGL